MKKKFVNFLWIEEEKKKIFKEKKIFKGKKFF